MTTTLPTQADILAALSRMDTLAAAELNGFMEPCKSDEVSA